MTPPPANYPISGTLAARVADWFRRGDNLEESLSDGDITIKFEVAPREIALLLDGAVKLQWLHRIKTTSRQHIYSAGRALRALVNTRDQAHTAVRTVMATSTMPPAPFTRALAITPGAPWPFQAPRAAPAPAPAPKPDRRLKTSRLPELDITQLRVDRDVRPCYRPRRLPSTKYDPVFQLLDAPQTSVRIHGDYLLSIRTAIPNFVNRHPGQRFRVLRDPQSSDHCRLFRDA